MIREIVLDTETTGLDARGGDRVVEIGCVELVNHLPTGRTYHVYLNPDRDMPIEAFNVHGLSSEFLSDKPRFADIAAQFVEFLGDAPLIIHNAAFDVGFLNAEFEGCGHPSLGPDRAVDTLMLSRRRHAAGPHSLDQLCLRYGIDNSRRTKHGALLDCELLAEVYLELIGGRQTALILGESVETDAVTAEIRVVHAARPAPLPPRLTETEIAAHAAFVETMGEAALWRRYIREAG